MISISGAKFLCAHSLANYKEYFGSNETYSSFDCVSVANLENRTRTDYALSMHGSRRRFT